MKGKFCCVMLMLACVLANVLVAGSGVFAEEL